MEKINYDNFSKKRIALIYGGASPEHEVSISSAKAVFPIMKELSNHVYLIGITKLGEFFVQNYNGKLNSEFTIKDKIEEINPISIIPAKGFFLNDENLNIDIAFPLTHGYGGEDGKLQGLLDLLKIPYAGCKTTASAICMSKDYASLILQSNNIPTLKSLVVDDKKTPPTLESVQNILGKNLFIKSETTGSSVGVTPLINPTEIEYETAIKYSFNYSNRVLIQKLIEDMDEVECAALETKDNIIIAGPGKVDKPDALLSYEIKYSPINGAKMNPKAFIEESIKQQIKAYAEKTFRVLGLSGYARIDFFLTKDNQIILNEINTLPGFTATSHYPTLMADFGMDFKETLARILLRATYG